VRFAACSTIVSLFDSFEPNYSVTTVQYSTVALLYSSWIETVRSRSTVSDKKGTIPRYRSRITVATFEVVL
jgi:hypothetical protein